MRKKLKNKVDCRDRFKKFLMGWPDYGTHLKNISKIRLKGVTLKLKLKKKNYNKKIKVLYIL